MERKKRSKGRGWESCYVKTIYGMFGVEMRAYGQKLVKFCTQTHRRVSFSSIDARIDVENELRPQCPAYDFHAGISLELVLFTYSCCVAVLDSKVVSIGWETGLGRCVQPSPGRVQDQGPGDR